MCKDVGVFYTKFDFVGALPLVADWLLRAEVRDHVVLEPFAGANSLVHMLLAQGLVGSNFEAFDIFPAHPDVQYRDTLADFPRGRHIIFTNPPFLYASAAARRGTAHHTDDLPYNDLYRHCLALCLANAPWVGCIVPASFVHTIPCEPSRLEHVVYLTYPGMFDNTTQPTALLLYTPHLNATPKVWERERLLGGLDTIRGSVELTLNSTGVLPFVFNAVHGQIGLRCLDSSSRPSIGFCAPGDVRTPKHTDRAITRVYLDRPCDFPRLIRTANSLLHDLRVNHHFDVLLTPYRGICKSTGGFRRRLSYDWAARILSAAMVH